MAKFHVELNVDEITKAVREYLARQHINVTDGSYIEIVDAFDVIVSDPTIRIENVFFTEDFKG